MKIQISPARKIFIVANYIIISLLVVLCLLPFIHLLAMSFSSASAVAANRVSLFPVEFTLAAYEFCLSGGKFVKSLLISLERVLLGASLNMIIIVLTAYPLSKDKRELFGRHVYMFFFFFTMIVNGGLIPTYILVMRLKLLNSIWALILPYSVNVFNMVIMMNFIRGLPKEIEESALVDGATPLRCLFSILLPLLTPSLATVGLFSIVNHWNDWFSGFIYMQDVNRYPLQTYLQTISVDFEAIMRSAGSDYAQILSQLNARTGRAAQLFLGALPVLIVYPFLQKYFTTGLVIGSVKG